MDPLLLWMSGGPYLSLGEKVAGAYKVGKEYKKGKAKGLERTEHPTNAGQDEA
jgi:hypothetical protein